MTAKYIVLGTKIKNGKKRILVVNKHLHEKKPKRLFTVYEKAPFGKKKTIVSEYVYPFRFEIVTKMWKANYIPGSARRKTMISNPYTRILAKIKRKRK